MERDTVFAGTMACSRSSVIRTVLPSAIPRLQRCPIRFDGTLPLYRAVLEAKGFRQSMGRTGTCADNARMESFSATLKKEVIYRLPLYRLTHDEVRGYVFAWIAYYNRKRRHNANERIMPPLVKRELYARVNRAAA